jgi:hypothetical protein
MKARGLTRSATPGFEVAGPDHRLRLAAIDFEKVTARHAAGTIYSLKDVLDSDFNVPLFTRSPLVVTLHDVLPPNSAKGR